VLEYVPRGWRERVAYLGHFPLSGSPLQYTYLIGQWSIGREALRGLEFPGEPDLASIQRHVFDGEGAEVGQLVVVEAATHTAGSTYVGLGANLAAGFNDYVLDRWLGDERLRYALTVFPGDAEAAAAEVRRHGGDPRVSSVWIPTSEQRFGDRHFYPVYEAAVELGLPIVSHPGGGGAMASPEAGLEGRMVAPTAVWTQVASLVAHGVFERFRELRFVFLESGFTWLEPLLARMDAAWRAGGRRVPQLVRAPSDVVREHLRLSTLPLDDDRDPAEIRRLIEQSPVLADVLVYTSNHPRGGDRPRAPFEGLPEGTRRKIFSDNARTALRIA
jgi:predicted TIM-barrel fold metal-dependent hydrolase